MGIETAECALFKQKREEWIECLDGEDRNSIGQQIIRMTWNAAAYRVINEARRLAPPDVEGGLQLNGLIHQLLDETFTQSHMVAVRRLTDLGGLAGKKGVFSLASLIGDIQTFRGLVTREHLFEAEDLKYDYEDVKQELTRYSDLQRAQVRRYEIRHEYIDRLCGVPGNARQKCDTIRADLLQHLNQRLTGASQDLRTHVDKFIAHGATPGSRAFVNADEANVTFDHLWSAHRTVCEVASFVSVHLLGGCSLHPLAVPLYDQFVYIERPLVAETDTAVLRRKWEEFDKESHEWGNWGLDEIEKEMSAVPASPV